mmetsp:Transcript_39477/g.90890  ORF Transcript_39477/g.90890 Transcript_39477/m.90890 type:complete len:231 (+) Transcript_39477:122-814(+)|eukprot:CAMPEP_0182563700 /NCGR_PEP_ID=MMETSP1324-20130603/5785_1 /TAXON_ID=236786 /ORGANISM="Florenciella sp., Strain RCC1587" /LENGTH=230 /DNA_ID=CAMNT_0024776961 /DNA_START=107 /DNA_END=799 /DNA_ORIENTATION=+
MMKAVASVVLALALGGVSEVAAYTTSTTPPRARAAPLKMGTSPQWVGPAAASAAAAALLSSAQPAYATIEEAAIKVVDTTYPIVTSLPPKDVAPVLSKAIKLGLSADPKALVNLIRAADAALLSTDPKALVAALKVVDATAEKALAKSALPPLADVEGVAKVASSALATADKAKVKEVANAVISLTGSLDKFQLLATTADGAKLASKVNPQDAAAATSALLELLKEAGAQ